MKRITVEVIKFEAKDGKIFSTEDQCILYEKRLDGTIRDCNNCEGKGFIEVRENRVSATEYLCAVCKGKGYTEAPPFNR